MLPTCKHSSVEVEATNDPLMESDGISVPHLQVNGAMLSLGDCHTAQGDSGASHSSVFHPRVALLHCTCMAKA